LRPSADDGDAVIGAFVAAAVDPDDARETAEHILNDRRFRSDPAPRPLRGPLEWIGDRLSSVGRWFGNLIDAVPGQVWLALLAAVLAAVVALVVRAIRNRGKRPARDGRGVVVGPDAIEDPDVLEREADAAERAGDLERALRLRFRAGLLRLGQRGAIQYRSSVTTGEVRRALRDEQFDDLARTFERVTYGGQEARPPDVETARREWPRVLETSGKS
jgi:hypothetical protein